MDIEKAIDCLRADKEYLTDMKICDGEEMDIAIKALEKQKTMECLLGKVVDTLVCQIGFVAVEHYDCCYASESEVGNQAIKILNTIKSNINSYLEEIAT